MRLPAQAASLLILSALASAPAVATEYRVGPGREHRQISSLLSSKALKPGDVVLVDGNAVYSGDIRVTADDDGAAGNPVIIRWSRDAGQTRPVIEGGVQHSFKFEESQYVVLEGFEITGGAKSCVFNAGHNNTVRDAVIHDCPAHGVIGADIGGGSFTLEYSEIYNAGSDTQKHSVYMASDEVAFPGAVFRMQYNYIHGGKGGNLVKSRHERNEIYYNWIEGAKYQELELIGPDCEVQEEENDGWTPSLKTENSDVVGNVIVHTSASWENAIRVGGDLNGRNMGHVRMVNNTILLDRSGGVNAVLVQLGQGRLEMHNNVIYQSKGVAPAIVREEPDVAVPVCAPFDRNPWASGRKVTGSKNWVQSGATFVPNASEWTGTLTGDNPGNWTDAEIAQRLLRPNAGSALLNAGNPAPPAPAGSPFPSPLLVPVADAPFRTKLAIGGQRARNTADGLDIGAFERAENLPGSEPRPMEGAQPLIPPHSQTLTPKPSAAPPPVHAPPPMPSTAARPAAIRMLPAIGTVEAPLAMRRRQFYWAVMFCMAPRPLTAWWAPLDAYGPMRCLLRSAAGR